MRIVASAPHLLVTDLARTVEFFVDVLGFQRPDLWGDPPAFAMPSRDGFIVMLEQCRGGEPRPHGAVDRWDAYFWCIGVDDYHARLREYGADLVHGPVDQPAYGMREIAVRDPDGHVLVFAEDLETVNADRGAEA